MGDCDDSRQHQLSNIIRETLENNGEIQKIRSLLKAKVLEVVRGGEKESITKSQDKFNHSSTNLLNKLILEYFHWFGYQYSLEMFSTESGIDSTCPSRINLENTLGTFEKDIPILLGMLNRVLEEKN